MRPRWMVATAACVCAGVLGVFVEARQGQTPAPARPAAPAQQPAAAPAQSGDLGYTDTPMLTGQPWHVHDSGRPHPPVVTPSDAPGAPPSDAIVLFNGKDLSKFGQRVAGQPNAPLAAATWPVRDGYFEVGKGDLYSREAFGDMQIHLEWAAPAEVKGTSQGRGNSGLKIMGLYEIQILDSFNNPTYADGQTGAIYGQWPPLVNATRKPGEWQTYDILFEAPKFDGDKVTKPAFVTVILNGVMLHVHKELLGTTLNRQLAKYTPHAAELPFFLQDHNTPVRYRNIWVRRTGTYDLPEKK